MLFAGRCHQITQRDYLIRIDRQVPSLKSISLPQTPQALGFLE